MALKLCGFSVSNYYSKLKLQLLEKQVPFEEELVWVGNTHPKLMDRSPMGKVPFLQTDHGCISESVVCAEYIEQAYPQHPLLPSDPLAAAKVRELIMVLELHLELVARELYVQAFLVAKSAKSVWPLCASSCPRAWPHLPSSQHSSPSWRANISAWRIARRRCTCR